MQDVRDLKIGDVVVLNSGGPDMTIIAYEGNYLYRCSWASDNGNFSAVFDSRCLQKIDPKPNREH